MTWLADLLLPQPRRPMSIELAPTETTAATGPTPIPKNPSAVGIEYPRLFTDGPLSAEDLERHLEGARNPRLLGLAGRVAAARSRLLDLTASDEALSMALDAAHYTGCDPEHWLENDLAEVLAQIEEAEAGRKRAQARAFARSARITPLRMAVSGLHTSLVGERDLLRERLWLLKKNGAGQIVDHALVRAGLTSEQIASLGPVGQDAVDLANYTARLEESAPKIAAIEAWQASGYRDHHHLAGLGFDGLIESAMPVGEEAAP